MIDFKKINFRQPKYMLPAILYLPIVGASYFVFDLFGTEVKDVEDKSLQTTEFLNPELPDAKLKAGDGIGSKYENMTKAWGKIADHTAVENIERDNPEENKEDYESHYTEEDKVLLNELEQQKNMEQEAADAQAREKEALAELERALAQARLQSQQVAQTVPQDTVAEPQEAPLEKQKGELAEDNKAVTALSEDDKPAEMVKKVKVTSDYFNTLTQNEQEPKLIKAIIDEDIKAVDGSRVRLRLLDDVEINETTLKKGAYLYATMSGFSSQRVKGNITSILVNDELIKVSLSIYDTDGMEGLYVPSSSFRETGKEVASSAVSGNMSMNNGTSENSFAQWGMQAVQNAYQKTTNAIGKAIKKNKVKLKYGTFVYLINSKEKRN